MKARVFFAVIVLASVTSFLIGPWDRKALLNGMCMGMALLGVGFLAALEHSEKRDRSEPFGTAEEER